MPRLFLVLLSLAATAIAAPAQAQSPACGTVLYSSVSLTADMVCQGGIDGLVIGADDVRIDLNGFEIRGPWTWGRPTGNAIGIRSTGFHGVHVTGPGRVVGFPDPIHLEEGNSHFIGKIEVHSESGLGVWLRNSSGSRIELSRLPFVIVESDVNGKAAGNHILDNDVGPFPGLFGGGITLRGCDTADNVVANNRINPNYGHAVSLLDGPHANQVIDNDVQLGMIVLGGASKNVIARNTLKSVGTASTVQLLASNPLPCANGAVLASNANEVIDNNLHGGPWGVYIEGSPMARPAAKNRIHSNRFNQQSFAAMFFGVHTASNDGRGNSYGMPAVAHDLGMNNRWP